MNFSCTSDEYSSLMARAFLCESSVKLFTFVRFSFHFCVYHPRLLRKWKNIWKTVRLTSPVDVLRIFLIRKFVFHHFFRCSRKSIFTFSFLIYFSAFTHWLRQSFLCGTRERELLQLLIILICCRHWAARKLSVLCGRAFIRCLLLTTIGENDDKALS